MARIQLNLRHLQSGQQKVAAFEHHDDAEAWLAERPPFVEVLGIANEGVPEDIDTRLRAARRPFDADEQALIAAQRTAHELEIQADEQTQRAQQLAEQAEHEERIAALGPDEPMELCWARGRGLFHADAADTRPISENVLREVEAWVAERDTWVQSRGQVVGEADITVWPNKIPDGQECVHGGGHFSPTFPDE